MCTVIYKEKKAKSDKKKAKSDKKKPRAIKKKSQEPRAKKLAKGQEREMGVAHIWRAVNKKLFILLSAFQPRTTLWCLYGMYSRAKVSLQAM